MGQTPRNLNMVAHPPAAFGAGPSLSLWERYSGRALDRNLHRTLTYYSMDPMYREEGEA